MGIKIIVDSHKQVPRYFYQISLQHRLDLPRGFAYEFDYRCKYYDDDVSVS